MELKPKDLEKIASLTLDYYNERAEDFWQRTRDHDVKQNIATLLQWVKGKTPFTILDFGCGPVAHGHKEGTITQRMADLRRALLTWASPPQRPGIEAMTYTQMVSTAFNQTGSHIVVATMKLEERDKRAAETK